jgi:hypothetical protein
MSFFPNLFYRHKEVPIKIPAIYFVEIDKLMTTFIWKGKRFSRANTALSKKSEVRGLALPNFRT